MPGTPLSDETIPERHRGFKSVLPFETILGFALAAIAVLLIAAFSLLSVQSRTVINGRIAQTLLFRDQMAAVLSALKDAETGTRGFLLTQRESYLEPYASANAALPAAWAGLRASTDNSPVQRERVVELKQLADEKMILLDRAIALRRRNETGGVDDLIIGGRGQNLMNSIRSLIAVMDAEEKSALERRQSEWSAASSLAAQVQVVGSAILLGLIALAAWLASRAHRTRERQMWLKAGQAGLAVRMQGDQQLNLLGQHVITYLCRLLQAPTGSIYLVTRSNRLQRIAGFGMDDVTTHETTDGIEDGTYNGTADGMADVTADGDHASSPGEGLLRQVARDHQLLQIRDVPEGYLPIHSALGTAASREVLIVPAVIDRRLHAVIELGFFRSTDSADRELLDQVSQMLAAAVRSSTDRNRLEELLTETQRQAEELQAQQEELRVNNEELEEQGQALRGTQVLLEGQQAQLEQSNVQLEERSHLLVSQRDQLTASQQVLELKTAELERSNQYKSEFLANMSHELRTPLNSSLILAKLLADNPRGNLSAEQVKFADTILSAGNDLLTLINDILDLSKIESGTVELNPEPVSIVVAMQSLTKGFESLARQKGLQLTTAIDAAVPDRVETDPHRLGQILRNLMSNACKFTSHGTVALRVSTEVPGRIDFEVSDTGIGIAPDHHDVIFEAFRQADGSTHRKYGGTGLGLSISRDLARRMGGSITLQSTPGIGSRFTLRLPTTWAPPAVDEPALPSAARSTGMPTRYGLADWVSVPVAGTAGSSMPGLAPIVVTPAGAKPTPRPIADDRDELRSTARLILVIEDDLRFAAILRDLAHEMEFQCVLTHTADEGLQAVAAYRPSAILLDMNLPDHSGLAVLDHLKHDPRTRHIPVHVLSVADYTREAMARGAAGYDLKPVKRVQLVEALQRLEAKFSQRLRHVLVVEDDEIQRQSIERLLANDEVQTTGVATAADALEALRRKTFDCMIMDLSLPDLSGFELLEQMAADGGASFPPVIVYTGRSLTAGEEQQLRRFSKSIIIKDARSPERLLDEVTLFLHQVEARLPVEMQRMLKLARDRDSTLERRRILVVEDDVRNIFALTSVLEPKGAVVQLARNGREALEVLARSQAVGGEPIDLVLMDIMMPEMDGYTAMREIRRQPVFARLPIIALTAKAMPDDQEKCLAAGANDYIAKPLDVEKMLSLIRVWMPQSERHGATAP